MPRRSLRDLLVKLFRVLGSDNANEREAARGRIDELLHKHRKDWGDLAALLCIGPTTISPNLAAHIGALGSRDAAEQEDARRWVADLLALRRKSWNDLADLLYAPTSPSWADDDQTSPIPDVNPFQLVHHVVCEYVALQPHEAVAVALWIMHAHVFDRFIVTPRLVLTSPTEGCGKSTLLSIIERLVPRAEKSDGITSAAIYHLIDRERPTLLVDEIDNADLALHGRMRALYNSGHRKGGAFTLMQRGQPHRFSTFAPVALAGIGTLPLPLMRRAVVIAMAKHDGQRELRRFNEDDCGLDATYAVLLRWARDVDLDLDPDLPTKLRNRPADNWRPLIAIADSCGWGAQAREAALTFAKGYQDEDAKVLLLSDIRNIFNACGVDRLISATLVGELNALEDAVWSEWRGLRGDQPMRRLSQTDLAMMLNPFGIRSKTIWPPNRSAGSRSAKGYLRSQFEAAWRSYCSDDTPSQPNNIRHLRPT